MAAETFEHATSAALDAEKFPAAEEFGALHMAEKNFQGPETGKARRFDPAGFPFFKSEDLKNMFKIAGHSALTSDNFTRLAPGMKYLWITLAQAAEAQATE